jgi:HTH-type transcriptional regulator/antitoxin HipB
MTASELLAERAAWVAQREARRRARAAAAAPAPECLCPDQCYEGACLSPCACQCEPDPSGPAAFLRTRWVA